MTNPITVVLIEDESPMRRFLRAAFGTEAITLIEASTAREGLAQVAGRRPDLVLLDLGLPDLDGLEVVRRIREWSTVPIIVLSARGREGDKVAVLDAGADDYLTKPFDLPELQARLRALIRRAGGAATPTLEHAGVVLEPASKRVLRDGQPIALSAREYALLHDLLSHKTHIRTRSQLEESLYAWGEETGSNTVEVYVHHLRKKLGTDFIRTVRGLGYQLGDTG